MLKTGPTGLFFFVLAVAVVNYFIFTKHFEKTSRSLTMIIMIYHKTSSTRILALYMIIYPVRVESSLILRSWTPAGTLNCRYYFKAKKFASWPSQGLLENGQVSTRYLTTGIVLKKLPGPVIGIGLKTKFFYFRNAMFQNFLDHAF